MAPSTDYRMRWFGEAPWSLLCEDCERVATPVGESCLHCGEAIARGEDGVVQVCIRRSRAPTWQPCHAECHFRAGVGGANHILGRCRCCGGDQDPDPPGLSKRQAARAAVLAWSEREKADGIGLDP